MQLRGTAIVVDTVAAKKPVISGSGATRTLNETESGSVVLFDRAAGIVYTLPVSPRAGTTYEFIVLDNVTSNAAKILADTAVLTGNIQLINDSDTLVAGVLAGTMFVANAGQVATNIAVSMNGTTTGGRAGTRIVATALSTGTWFVGGTAIASGSFATPFAAS